MFTAVMLEQGKFGKKKKLPIPIRSEHSKVSTVYILRTLLVSPDAFRWDRTGVESSQMVGWSWRYQGCWYHSWYLWVKCRKDKECKEISETEITANGWRGEGENQAWETDGLKNFKTRLEQKVCPSITGTPLMWLVPGCWGSQNIYYLLALWIRHL